MGCHSLLQGIFLTQGSNSGFLHCRQILYRLSHQGNPSYLCANYLCCNVKKFTCPVFLSSDSTLCTCFHPLNLVGYTIVDLYVFVVGDNYNHQQHQFSSVTQLCPTLCNPILQHARPPCPSPNPRVYSNLSIESVMPSNHLILCCPLLLLPPIPPSIRVFSNESVLHIRWPKYWSFSFRISPSNEYSGLVSFRIAWFDLLAVQGTLRNLL